MLLFDVFGVITICFLKRNVDGKGIRAEGIISSEYGDAEKQQGAGLNE